MKDFETIDVYYTCLKLEEGGFLNLSKKYTGDLGIEFDIESMTYHGHEFLETVRNEDVFHKIVGLFTDAGSLTISGLFEVSKEVAAAIVKAKLSEMFKITL